MANSTFYFELNTYRKDKTGCIPIRLNYQVDSMRKRIQTSKSFIWISAPLQGFCPMWIFTNCQWLRT